VYADFQRFLRGFFVAYRSVRVAVTKTTEGRPRLPSGNSGERPKEGTMKKLLVGAMAVMSVLLLGSPASATQGEAVGDRINLLLGTPTTYPANTPFHILHGWGPNEQFRPAAIGGYSFALDVDGVPRAEDFVIRDAIPQGSDTPFHFRLWVFNFPDGMTGTHTFTGHWFQPCAAAVEFNGYPGPCSSPAEQVEEETRSVTVTFTP
jgi:hypothetical protein